MKPDSGAGGVAGVLLGAIFFGGLWWTVRKGVSSKRPALCFFGSLLLRTSIALAGFYFVGRSLGAAAGVSPRICHGTPYRDAAHPPAGEQANASSKEASHAP
jgi:F1F0 ATPase subunit 2